jgi:predicted ribosomally synthesized peptide with SipW-like signal peptide
MKKKTFVMILALVLVLGLAVGGTIAYLTATSSEVKNTFTVGKIEIKLEEHSDGTSTGDVVTSRENIKVLPGSTVAKDPFVTVLSGSEKCYVYAKVVNSLAVTRNSAATNVATLTLGTGWTPVATKTADGVVTTLYKYGTEVDAATADQVLAAVFTQVKIADDVTSEELPSLQNKTIVIQAYAHQSDNVTATVMDAAATEWAGLN